MFRKVCECDCPGQDFHGFSYQNYISWHIWMDMKCDCDIMLFIITVSPYSVAISVYSLYHAHCSLGVASLAGGRRLWSWSTSYVCNDIYAEL